MNQRTSRLIEPNSDHVFFGAMLDHPFRSLLSGLPEERALPEHAQIWNGSGF
jgi:hypothetical protein